METKDIFFAIVLGIIVIGFVGWFVMSMWMLERNYDGVPEMYIYNNIKTQEELRVVHGHYVAFCKMYDIEHVMDFNSFCLADFYDSPSRAEIKANPARARLFLRDNSFTHNFCAFNQLLVRDISNSPYLWSFWLLLHGKLSDDSIMSYVLSTKFCMYMGKHKRRVQHELMLVVLSNQIGYFEHAHNTSHPPNPFSRVCARSTRP